MHTSAPAWEYGWRISYLLFLLGEEISSAPCVRLPGLLIVVAMRPLFLVFGIQLAGMFKYPTFYVGVVGWFIRGAMDLT